MKIDCFRMSDTLKMISFLEKVPNLRCLNVSWSDKLINSFWSSFWTDEHRWFIRCFTHGKTIHLQTLSNIFYHYKRQLPDSWKSTYPDDDHQRLWNTIQHVHRYTLFEQPTPSCIRLHNIHFLSIAFPIHEKFWSIVPSFKNLIFLIVSSYHWYISISITRFIYMEKIIIILLTSQ